MICEIEMFANTDENVTMWCKTCHESVAEKTFWTIQEVRATAYGHEQTMATARALRAQHERKRK